MSISYGTTGSISIPTYGSISLPGSGSTWAVQMTAAASGSSGISVPDSDEYDLAASDFGVYYKGSRTTWRPAAPEEIAIKYQDASNYVALICNTDGTINLIAVVGGVTILDETSSAAVPEAYNNVVIQLTFAVTRETSGAAGSFVPYLNAAILGASQAITAAATTSISNTGLLYIMGTDAARFASNTVSFILLNFAPTAAQVSTLYSSGIPEEWMWGSNVPVYSSDFSAGVDGFVGSNATVSGNNDGVGGEDNVLNIQSTNAIDANASKDNITTIGERMALSFIFYHSGNATTTGIAVWAGGAPITAIAGASAAQASSGTWTKFYVEYVGISTAITFYPVNAVGSRTTTVGDIISIKNVLTRVVGATLALLPETLPISPALEWPDSANGNDATLPAAGATKVTIRA